MVARMVRDHKVVGSNPVASTKINEKSPFLSEFRPKSGFFYIKYSRFGGNFGGKLCLSFRSLRQMRLRSNFIIDKLFILNFLIKP